MNELHKYATFSVDLLGTPNRINSMFSIGRARIFYKGINRNRSIIDGEVADKLALTIPGTPVIGTYNYDTNDFEGHEDNPSAYGFIPLEPNMTWVKFTDNENKEREYLEVDVVVWDGYFEEAQDILSKSKHLSMELNPKTLKGTFERIGDKTYYRMVNAEFAGITVLGDDYEPCFKDAQFITAFSNMVSQYALYIESIQKNNEGGKNIMDNIIEIVEPEVTTETVTEEVVTEEAEVVTEEVTETENNEITETEEVVEETPEAETVEIVEAPEDNSEFEKDEEACPECGKNPCVCKSSENSDESDDEDDKDEDDDKKDEEEEFKCNKEDYEALEAKYSALEAKYNEALNSLNKYTKKEKLEIINKFSTKLESEELIEKLTSDVDNYTLDEIKSELGQALVEQLSTEEDSTEDSAKETNFSLNINLNDNSLNNSAWDLVRRHKENK